MRTRLYLFLFYIFFNFGQYSATTFILNYVHNTHMNKACTVNNFIEQNPNVNRRHFRSSILRKDIKTVTATLLGSTELAVSWQLNRLN